MIIITGATGYVGRQLLQHFPPDANLLLVSRDALALEDQGYAVIDYAGLREIDFASAVFIHLAVRNNDAPGNLDEFRETNVAFLMEVAKIAKQGNAQRFINICSIHALDPGERDNYGISKQEGATRLREYWPDGTVNLYLPAVRGDLLRGRLAALNGLPGFMRASAVSALKQVKPTIAIDHLARVLRELATAGELPGGARRACQFVADPVSAVGLYAAIKRASDLTAGLVILLLGWPFLALLAVYIRLDSAGPALFLQKRVGQDGKEFTCFKFRTMTVGTGDLATHDVSVAAVTKAGRFLRRTKLDELPQAINLVRNQMSLVGPRPCLPSQHELISARRERGVLCAKPGITGLAQINDIDMSDPALLAAWDARYVAFRTTATDFIICARTLLGGGSGDRTKNAAGPKQHAVQGSDGADR